MRKDGIFELVLVELIFVDVISEKVEDLGGNVESVVDEDDVDEFQRRREGSSHMEEDWKRLSLTRNTGSTRRRVDTLLSEKRDEDMYLTKERDLGEVRMAVMNTRSALPDSYGSSTQSSDLCSCAGTVGDDEQKSTN